MFIFYIFPTGEKVLSYKWGLQKALEMTRLLPSLIFPMHQWISFNQELQCLRSFTGSRQLADWHQLIFLILTSYLWIEN